MDRSGALTIEAESNAESSPTIWRFHPAKVFEESILIFSELADCRSLFIFFARFGVQPTRPDHHHPKIPGFKPLPAPTDELSSLHL